MWGGQFERKQFYDYQGWGNYIEKEKFSFAFGTRFHGNMMALRNNVPTLWIVHDWRTLELVQYLDLPYLNLYGTQLSNCNTLEKLFEYCDYRKMYSSYAEKRKKYREFLLKNGL